jgi:hypothetical protein
VPAQHEVTMMVAIMVLLAVLGVAVVSWTWWFSAVWLRQRNADA